MIRDNLKDKIYFQESISKRENLIQKNIDLIESGKVAQDRINQLKEFRIGLYKNNLTARYSFGADMNSDKVKSDYINAIKLMDEVWSPKGWNMKHKIGKKDIVSLNQYTFSGFLDFSKMLSLGILLDIPKEYVLKLVKFIDGDQVRDFFLEFLIGHLIPGREKIIEESYTEYFHVNERYKLLKEIIKEDKIDAQQNLKFFLDKKWYNSLKGTPMHNQHNNPHDTYVGYWCFQAAAITRLMELDDSSYQDNPYYPKDLV